MSAVDYRAAGAAAFGIGSMRVPWFDRAVSALMVDQPVGTVAVKTAMREWSAGWDAANCAAGNARHPMNDPIGHLGEVAADPKGGYTATCPDCGWTASTYTAGDSKAQNYARIRRTARSHRTSIINDAERLHAQWLKWEHQGGAAEARAYAALAAFVAKFKLQGSQYDPDNGEARSNG